jgi:hypothetical protein
MVVNMLSESELKEVAQWGQQQAQHAHQQSGYI